METEMVKREKISTKRLREMNQKGEKISMLTAYDFSMASVVDEAGIDIILVGDSAANVMAGYSSTLPITLDEMIYHASCVVRAVQYAFVVVDMPFGSYQGSPEQALAAAVRIMKETGADCVKLEGGAEIRDAVSKILNAGIPVIGHLGLTPQSIHAFGSYGLQASTEHEAKKLLEDAKMLEEIGCTAVVLEKIPTEVARKATELLYIPTIGIGAGPYVDGQVLVLHDMLGINTAFSPRFVRRYANLHEEMGNAVKNYIRDVKTGSFPNEKESY